MHCPRPRCGQLMLRDCDDPAQHKYPSCGASTFRPAPDTLAHERDNENHVHGYRGITARSTKGRHVGLPQGALNVITRRFA